MNRHPNGCKFQLYSSCIQSYCISLLFLNLHICWAHPFCHTCWEVSLGLSRSSQLAVLSCPPSRCSRLRRGWWPSFWGHLPLHSPRSHVLSISACVSEAASLCSFWKVLGTGNLTESVPPAQRIPSSQKDLKAVALRGLAVSPRLLSTDLSPIPSLFPRLLPHSKLFLTFFVPSQCALMIL